MTRQTRLKDDLRLTSCEWLGLMAMVESISGRALGWEAELHTLGDLLDYLEYQGIEMGETCK